MGRPGLTHHRKFVRLSRLVGNQALARGSLELMWDAAYESGDDLMGDAGDLEHLVGWAGEPGTLSQALVEAGFLDQTPEGLRVHDLMDHAPDYVQKRKAREQARRGKSISDVRRDAAAARWNANESKRMQVSAACNANGRTPAPTPAPTPLEAITSPSAPGTTISDIDTTGVLEADEPRVRVCAPARDDEPLPLLSEAPAIRPGPVPTNRDPEKSPIDALVKFAGLEQPELPGPPPPPGPDDMMRVWNEKAPPKCPRVQKMTEGRRKAASARLEEHKGEQGGALAWWERVVAKVAASSFLRGDKAPWCADIDFVLKPGKLVGILEGKYDDVRPEQDVRQGTVRAEDMHHSERVGVMSMEEWTEGKA